MLNIVFTRIDDRLIHGQVVAGWMRQTMANRIIIVDNDVAKDPFMLQVLKIAAPPKVAVGAYTIEDAIEVLKGEPSSPNEKVIVLVKTPDIILELVDAGVEIRELNVGGMGLKQGRKPLFRNIQATPEEIETFKKLDSLGVEIIFRVIVTDAPVPLKEVLAGRKR